MGRVLQPQKLHFLALMLFPLGLMPLLSPMRLFVAAPIFGYMLLGDRAFLCQPWFHFHGPLVPILLWSCVGGASRLSRVLRDEGWTVWLSRSVACMALTTGFWFGQSPLSWKFHDPFHGMPREIWDGAMLFKPGEGVSYWGDRYFSEERALAFNAAVGTVKPEDVVAATDYVRGRFTHHRAAVVYPSLPSHFPIETIDVIFIDKLEGHWGRTETNPDRELLDCLSAPCEVGTIIDVRGQSFRILVNDRFFFVARRQ
jgi:hypothetical protein